MKKRFYSIIIMDGFGINKNTEGNAIAKSGTPHLNKILSEYPNTLIGASGLNVGLPDGQMGNSEVGHLNIGAGRIVYQELTRITKDINEGTFFDNQALVKACEHAKSNGKALHLFGLLSNGGVHSHITHLYALLELAKRQGLKDVFVHCFMDGRDVSPTSGLGFIRDLEAKMAEIGVGKIADVTGRFYAMDRDFAWDRVNKAYDMLVNGEGIPFKNAETLMQTSYENGVTDEFVLPSVIVDDNGAPVGDIKKGDSIIFFNFRPDRAREITRSFIYEDFDGFERKGGWVAPYFVGFTQYDETFTGWDVAFRPAVYTNTFGEYVSKLGLKQLRIAETQKYAHVTFFFNGGVELVNEGEDRVLIPSPRIATFDMQPEMSAYEVTDKAIELIRSGKYDLMVLNFANCDMVGHTGVMDAAVKAVDTVDECVDKLAKVILDMGGMALITADHGNADIMFTDDGKPFTAHTTNPVPLILLDNENKDAHLADGGILADIVPTLFDVMGIEKPAEMTGRSLLVK